MFGGKEEFEEWISSIIDFIAMKILLRFWIWFMELEAAVGNN